jgi:hypothetical protein
MIWLAALNESADEAASALRKEPFLSRNSRIMDDRAISILSVAVSSEVAS